jgi:hypothetical protein
MNRKEREAASQELFVNIKKHLEHLEALLAEISTDDWGFEDAFYRFYHQSFKVYGLQNETQRIIQALQKIAPERTIFCEYFNKIVLDGTGKEFDLTHNSDWLFHTRPIIEAFLHARYFLQLAVKFGRKLDESLNMLPSGWAALLCLYGIR